jgi:uncharacterized protein (DUF2235 family)
VESVGWVSKGLPLCKTNNAIEVFRHALALDERRVKFIPSFYKSGKPKHDNTNSEGQQASNSMSQRTDTKIQRTVVGQEPECRRNAKLGKKTDFEEVFFAGAHSGTIWFSLQSVSCLPVPFQMSGVDL